MKRGLIGLLVVIIIVAGVIGLKKAVEISTERAEETRETFEHLEETIEKLAVQWRDKENRLGAYVSAQWYVEQRLKAPSTAKFGACVTTDTTEYCTEYLGNQRYRVATYVDAQNAFGAMLRTYFVCVMEQTADDYFELESLEFD